MSEDKKFVSDIFGTVNSEKPKEESGWLIKSIVSKLKGRGVESKKRQIEERKLDIELAKLNLEVAKLEKETDKELRREIK